MSGYVTKSGKVLTDEDLEALAAEAEQGYDVTKQIETVRAGLIMEQAVDQMYVWADREMANVWMDCPDLRCEHAILLGATPSLAYIKEAAREHVRTAHGGGPITLVIEPEGPVHDPERGGTVVDDPAP